MNKEELLAFLRNPQNAADYLNVHLEKILIDDYAFARALRNVAAAVGVEGGNRIRATAKQTSVILSKLNLRLTVVKEKKNADG